MKKSSEKKVFQPSQQELIRYYEWGKIVQNDTRLAILMYLRMNRQLSFSQLTQLLKKSKSTVHHHLQILIRGGIVQEVETSLVRDQFDPKYYELTPRPRSFFSFHNIHELPIEKQKEAFLTSTKIHQNSIFYLYQMMDLFKEYLDTIEEEILTNQELTPQDLQMMWKGVSESPIKVSTKLDFKDFFYFSTQVNEEVYLQYKKELDDFHERLVQLSNKNLEKGGVKQKPYFIFHVSAPLGKPFVVAEEEEKLEGKNLESK